MANQHQLTSIKLRYAELDRESQGLVDSALLNEYHVQDIKELTATQADDVHDRLTRLVAKLKAKQITKVKVTKLAGEPANEPEPKEELLFEEGT